MPQEGAVVAYRPSEPHVISDAVVGPQHDSQESGQTSSSQCGGKSRPGVVVVARSAVEWGVHDAVGDGCGRTTSGGIL